MIEFPSFDKSIFTTMSALAKEHNAINLGQGIPDGTLPDAIFQAASSAMRSGRNQYSPSPGIPELRDEISLTGDLCGYYNPATEITVFAGCTEALSAIFMSLTEPGDEILAFEPYYDYYPAMAAIGGGRLRPVPLIDAGTQFSLDADGLRRAASSSRARFLLLNSPHNPTGHVFSAEELSEIAAVSIEHNLTVVSDEVYEHYTYDRPHRSIAKWPGMRERTIVASSASKTFNLTGWRVGWTQADERYTQKIRAAHVFLSFCAATPLQHGISAGLRWSRESDYFSELRIGSLKRRDRLLSSLRASGFTPIVPSGSYFIMANARRWQSDDIVDFCRDMTIAGGVTPLPLLSFFSDQERAQRYLRFVFCRTDDLIEEASNRLLRYAQTRLRQQS